MRKNSRRLFIRRLFIRRRMISISVAILLTTLLVTLPSNTAMASDPLWVGGSTSPPTYRVLPRPLSNHEGKHVPYSTTHQPTEKANIESHATSPYAYGWFGPQANPHWSRHFGYQQRYTQWSLK